MRNYVELMMNLTIRREAVCQCERVCVCVLMFLIILFVSNMNNVNSDESFQQQNLRLHPARRVSTSSSVLLHISEGGDKKKKKKSRPASCHKGEGLRGGICF